MPYKNGTIVPNAIVWTTEMISFLKDNFFTMTNAQLAAALNLKLTSVRTKCYQLGLKRMEMEYWNEDEVAFLLNNYKEIGDSEIADLLNVVSPKNKKWTLKHIEKKRRYLKLPRTKEEIAAIKKRNTEIGCFSFNHWRRWDNTANKIGTIVIWENAGRKYKAIKTETGYVHYAPWLYQQHFGKIPEGHVVTFKDRDNMNVVPENLEVITRAEHAQRNKNSKYPEDVRELMKALKILNHTINSKQNAKQQ